MPGHHTLVRKRSFIATIPGWPSCTNFSASQRSCFGNAIRVPRWTIIPIPLNSPHTGRYSMNSIACHLPFKRHSRTLFSSGSCSDAFSISIQEFSRQQTLIRELPTSHILISFSSLYCGTGRRRQLSSSFQFLLFYRKLINIVYRNAEIKKKYKQIS